MRTGDDDHLPLAPCRWLRRPLRSDPYCCLLRPLVSDPALRDFPRRGPTTSGGLAGIDEVVEYRRASCLFSYGFSWVAATNTRGLLAGWGRPDHAPSAQSGTPGRSRVGGSTERRRKRRREGSLRVLSAVFAMSAMGRSTSDSGKIVAAQRTDVEGQRRTYFALNSGLISPASVTPSICASSIASGKTQNGESGSNGAGSRVML